MWYYLWFQVSLSCLGQKKKKKDKERLLDINMDVDRINLHYLLLHIYVIDKHIYSEAKLLFMKAQYDSQEK